MSSHVLPVVFIMPFAIYSSRIRMPIAKKQAIFSAVFPDQNIELWMPDKNRLIIDHVSLRYYVLAGVILALVGVVGFIASALSPPSRVLPMLFVSTGLLVTSVIVIVLSYARRIVLARSGEWCVKRLGKRIVTGRPIEVLFRPSSTVPSNRAGFFTYDIVLVFESGDVVPLLSLHYPEQELDSSIPEILALFFAIHVRSLRPSGRREDEYVEIVKELNQIQVHDAPFLYFVR